MSDVPRLLDAAAAGDRRAAADLLPLVYDELRRLAAARLAREAPGQTLQPTALVHEAYLRLVGLAGESRWDHRGHLFAAAAEAMRRLLVDAPRPPSPPPPPGPGPPPRAVAPRRKRRVRHGGHLHRIELTDLPADDSDRLIDLDDALTRLAAEDTLAAKVVELRHFAGLGHEAV